MTSSLLQNSNSEQEQLFITTSTESLFQGDVLFGSVFLKLLERAPRSLLSLRLIIFEELTQTQDQTIKNKKINIHQNLEINLDRLSGEADFEKGFHKFSFSLPIDLNFPVSTDLCEIPSDWFKKGDPDYKSLPKNKPVGSSKVVPSSHQTRTSVRVFSRLIANFQCFESLDNSSVPQMPNPEARNLKGEKDIILKPWNPSLLTVKKLTIGTTYKLLCKKAEEIKILATIDSSFKSVDQTQPKSLQSDTKSHGRRQTSQIDAFDKIQNDSSEVKHLRDDRDLRIPGPSFTSLQNEQENMLKSEKTIVSPAIRPLDVSIDLGHSAREMNFKNLKLELFHEMKLKNYEEELNDISNGTKQRLKSQVLSSVRLLALREIPLFEKKKNSRRRSPTKRSTVKTESFNLRPPENQPQSSITSKQGLVKSTRAQALNGNLINTTMELPFEVLDYPSNVSHFLESKYRLRISVQNHEFLKKDYVASVEVPLDVRSQPERKKSGSKATKLALSSNHLSIMLPSTSQIELLLKNPRTPEFPATPQQNRSGSIETNKENQSQSANHASDQSVLESGFKKSGLFTAAANKVKIASLAQASAPMGDSCRKKRKIRAEDNSNQTVFFMSILENNIDKKIENLIQNNTEKHAYSENLNPGDFSVKSLKKGLGQLGSKLGSFCENVDLAQNSFHRRDTAVRSPTRTPQNELRLHSRSKFGTTTALRDDFLIPSSNTKENPMKKPPKVPRRSFTPSMRLQPIPIDSRVL